MVVREKIVWMIRWINNIQARWGLPYAYSLGKGGGGGGRAGHNEPTMRSSARQGDIDIWSAREKRALSFSCILRKMVASLTDDSREKRHGNLGAKLRS